MCHCNSGNKYSQQKNKKLCQKEEFKDFERSSLKQKIEKKK